MAYGMTTSKRLLTSAGQRGAPRPMWHRDASQRPPWRSGFPAPYVLPCAPVPRIRPIALHHAFVAPGLGSSEWNGIVVVLGRRIGRTRVILDLPFLAWRGVQRPVVPEPHGWVGLLLPVQTTLKKLESRGLVFGLTNPKAYPVSLAVFTALTVRHAGEISWASAPGLMGAAICGFLAGYVVILFWAGLQPVRRFFLKHGRAVSRVVGVTFVLFDADTLEAYEAAAIRQS